MRGTRLPEPWRTVVRLLEETDDAPEGLELYEWTVLEDTLRIEESFDVPLLGGTIGDEDNSSIVLTNWRGSLKGYDFRAGWREDERVGLILYSKARVA